MKTIITRALIGVSGAVVVALIGRGIFDSPEPGPKTYTGRVVNARTEAPVQGASVSLEGFGVPDVKYTDNRGIFNFSLQKKATSIQTSVRVEAANYDTFRANVNIHGDGSLEDIRLKPSDPPNEQASAKSAEPEKATRQAARDRIWKTLAKQTNENWRRGVELTFTGNNAPEVKLVEGEPGFSLNWPRMGGLNQDGWFVIAPLDPAKTALTSVRDATGNEEKIEPDGRASVELEQFTPATIIFGGKKYELFFSDPPIVNYVLHPPGQLYDFNPVKDFKVKVRGTGDLLPVSPPPEWQPK
jgi:hypothetical protein